MTDGVDLAASLYVPDGDPPAAGWPAVMVFHGLGGDRRSSNVAAEQFVAPQGYAVLTADHRGHGESGGVVDIDGPREIEAVRELFSWLAARADVDERRIGAIGFSLGGGAVWRATVEGVGFRAIVPATTWTDLYAALFPGDLAKSGAVLGFLTSLPPERFSPLVNGLRGDLIGSRNLDAARTLARERSALPLLDSVRIPVFLIQGRRDFAFDVAQARTAFTRLRSNPARLYIGDLGHAPAANPPAELPHVLTEARLWFDRFLKGLPNGIDTRPPVELAADPWTGRTSEYRSLPATRTLAFASRRRGALVPGGKVVRTFGLPRRPLETFGAPMVRATVSTPTQWPRLVAVLLARAPRRAGDSRERGRRPNVVAGTQAQHADAEADRPGDAHSARVAAAPDAGELLHRPKPGQPSLPRHTARGRRARDRPLGPRHAAGAAPADLASTQRLPRGAPMTKRFRLAVAVAALGSLVFAAPALGAFEPRLTVTASEGEVALRAALVAQDDPPARIVFYAPTGWSASLGQAPGTQIGTVTGRVTVADFGGAEVPVTGVVRTDNPANYVANPCSPGSHGAVWLLVLTAGTTQLQPVPMYVDVASGAEAAFASLKITLCLPPPDVPPGTPGRATNGVKLLDATITLQNVFTTGAGNRWTAVFTPYTPGVGQVNVPGTAESQSVTRLGARLTITARRIRRGGRFFARITGRLRVGAEGIGDATVRLTANGRAAGSARTNENGGFSKTVRIKRTTRFRARATAAGTEQSGGCEPLLPLPTGGTARCTVVTLGSFTAASNTARVTVPKRKRGRRR